MQINRAISTAFKIQKFCGYFEQSSASKTSKQHLFALLVRYLGLCQRFAGPYSLARSGQTF